MVYVELFIPDGFLGYGHRLGYQEAAECGSLGVEFNMRKLRHIV